MKRVFSCFIIFVLILAQTGPVSAAADDSEIDEILSVSAKYLSARIPNPSFGSVGGEWAVFGLSRSESPVPDNYYEDYYARIEEYIQSKNGVLHEKKYTEYSRLVIALTAIGKNPTDVSGYNLLTPLGDYEKVIYQGINGPIWALIALDCGNYKMPSNPNAAVQATRNMYIDKILASQNSDGGFSLSAGGESEPDITAMALTALAKYRHMSRVENAVDKALSYLSKIQTEDGGFKSFGVSNSESTAQVIVALCSLGISVNDPRFVKNGNTVSDNLLSFRLENGAFMHVKEGGTENQMSTEQCFYALTAVNRALKGQSALYAISGQSHAHMPFIIAKVGKFDRVTVCMLDGKRGKE